MTQTFYFIYLVIFFIYFLSAIKQDEKMSWEEAIVTFQS